MPNTNPEGETGLISITGNQMELKKKLWLKDMELQGKLERQNPVPRGCRKQLTASISIHILGLSGRRAVNLPLAFPFIRAKATWHRFL